jgi:hypothetical protein
MAICKSGLLGPDVEVASTLRRLRAACLFLGSSTAQHGWWWFLLFTGREFDFFFPYFTRAWSIGGWACHC